jgi:hypothetical protein
VTPVEACTQAVAYNHAVEADDLRGNDKNQRLAYQRRLAAYVAHTHFAEHADTVAAYFGRQASWVFDICNRVTDEMRGSRITGRDVDDTVRRARAILDRHGVTVERERAATLSPLSEQHTAEAKKLRAKGWAIPGLAKRYGITPQQMAPIVGETWGPQP